MGLSKSKPPRSSPPLSLFRCSIVSYSLLPKSFTRSPIASPLIVAPLIPVSSSSSSSSSSGTFMANFMTSFFCCGTPVFWPIIASLCSMEIMWIEELGVLRHSFSCWLGRFLCRIGYIFFVEIMNQNTVLNEKEVLTKYGDSGKHVYRKCLGCFEGLPLASIIAGRVYLGSLEELSTARRSVLDPPWEGLNLIPGDVLWSDPSMSPGLSPNKERGIGLLWGPDCTDEFLKKFNLKLIIRSHEGPDAREKRSDLAAGMDEGYTIDHVVDSGKLITLFSAPDYPQFQATRRYKNKGAYIVLELPHFDSPVFHSFEAITSRPKVLCQLISVQGKVVINSTFSFDEHSRVLPFFYLRCATRHLRGHIPIIYRSLISSTAWGFPSPLLSL